MLWIIYTFNSRFIDDRFDNHVERPDYLLLLNIFLDYLNEFLPVSLCLSRSYTRNILKFING